MSIKILSSILFFLILFASWLIKPYFLKQSLSETPPGITAASAPEKYSASVSVSALEQTNPNFLPIRDLAVEEPGMKAKAVLIYELEKDKILYQKNIKEILPIASLTKLMTALIVLENMDLEQKITVSEKAINSFGRTGGLKINEEISVKNLLYVMLMESSNDAAAALAENAPDFVDLMNRKAEEIGLKDTRFTDPSGYDPLNVSSAIDLAALVKYSLDKPLIWDILKTPSIDLQSTDGWINHHLVNTNLLLKKWPEVIGGKTGYTEEAKECIVLLIKISNENYLIAVVLSAEDRFKEAEKLLDWIKKAYIW